MCPCVCGKIVFKFIFRGITVTKAILNEAMVTFIGFWANFSQENDDDFPKSSKEHWHANKISVIFCYKIL